MTEPIVLTPIGVVRGGRSQIFEDHWGAVVSRLVLDPAVLDPAAADHPDRRQHDGLSHPGRSPFWAVFR